ncbi:hypothetical protein [Paraglaciecola sp. 2405UD69-4]|uniref:hypothetical protein n=1 Tax=Paraglaciecola sp. 2405UD69-4 TaxID=3391836 RepID=UPI0039C8F5D5
MDPLKITVVLSSIALASLAICWLDYKKGWQLADWLNGRCSNPFIQANLSHKTESGPSNDEKDALILELKERVQILEKIVTEPAYELNKKLNEL